MGEFHRLWRLMFYGLTVLGPKSHRQTRSRAQDNGGLDVVLYGIYLYIAYRRIRCEEQDQEDQG
jgi:hypothetical protein